MTTSIPWWRTDSRFSTRWPCRTRGRVFRQTEELLTVLDLETTVPTEPRPKRPLRVVVAGFLAAAAAVTAIALVVTRDGTNRPRS